MAANWPWALHLLLDSGADVSVVDRAGILPLSYACFFGCHEGVDILLSADSPLSSAHRRYTVLDDASMVRDMPCITLVTTALALRRRRVFNIARSILPSHAFNVFPQCNEENLDTESGNIIQALQKSGVNVNPHFISFTDRSVYHTENLLPDTAELLYNLGFTNLEGRDERGMTPLASVFDGHDSKIKLVPWLVSKGANLQDCFEPFFDLGHDGLKIVHLVAAGVGTNLRKKFANGWRFQRTPLQRFHDYGIETMKLLLGPESSVCYDHCNCLCSKTGCSPLTMILKSYPYSYQKWTNVRLTIVDWILKVGDLDPSTKHKVALEALRFILFDEMDLTHTCCKPNGLCIKPAMDEEEASEVRDEEVDMGFQLEALYERAVLEWEGSSEFFHRFLRNFIREEISRQHRQQGIDPEYAQTLREIGVRLQEVSDGEEDSTISSFSDDSDHFDSTAPREVVEIGSGAHNTLSNSTARIVEL
jgi:hypothetical protein